MARYFLHLRDGTDDVLDAEGIEYGTHELMRAGVMECARDVLCGDIKRGILDLRFRIEAEDEQGEVVYTLPLKHAFSIVPADN
jgi:hypothetical protein